MHPKERSLRVRCFGRSCHHVDRWNSAFLFEVVFLWCESHSSRFTSTLPIGYVVPAELPCQNAIHKKHFRFLVFFGRNVCAHAFFRATKILMFVICCVQLRTCRWEAAGSKNSVCAEVTRHLNSSHSRTNWSHFSTASLSSPSISTSHRRTKL